MLIPGTYFNSNRDRLFFFWSQDILPRNDPGGLQNSTMPTALERAGDFSQTVGTNGNRIWIKDPLLAAQGLACNANTGGPGCFANNIIPADRINPHRRGDPEPVPDAERHRPVGHAAVQLPVRRQHRKTQARPGAARSTGTLCREGRRSTPACSSGMKSARAATSRSAAVNLFLQGNWPQMQNSYDIDTLSSANTLLHTFNSTTVLEATVGLNNSAQKVYALSQADLDAVNRDLVIPGLHQFFPEANPFNLIPNFTFGGTNALPNTRTIGGFEQRYPFDARNPTWDITTSLTKQRGSHNLKAGIFIERVLRPARRQSSFNGTYNFSANAANPFDTNYSFANALLGSINSYTESTSRPFAEGRFNQIEFFAQDNWRLSRKVTLDLGVRFVHIGATYVAGQQVAYFDPAT